MLFKEDIEMYNKMTKKQLIQEIKRFDDFVDFVCDKMVIDKREYTLYPPYYIKEEEWPYNYPNPLPKWPNGPTCTQKDGTMS